ncbi:MATE family efflux transporter [Hungatella effluvii]|uniref:MATE family efflux transporter n=1 Tax=Hungatella effluvii TaxID=1096246 RepID=UPI0022E76843|nr:MATE family efflux transporter [Hungatella effluvii]
MDNESIMGTIPIPRLIIKTSIPLIISLLVNNLYNLVDSIFVARVSEEALTGISLAAPLQMIMIALGCGLAVGLNAMVSRSMGEKKREEVKKTTSAAIVMAFGAYLINVIVCLLVVKSYFAWQAGGNEAIARYGTSYIQICMLFSFGQMIQWVFDRLLIATGKSTLFLATLGTASVVNVILDPILIFGYFGFLAMGTAGAAIATVTGQLAGGLLGIYLNIKRNQEIPIHFTLHIQKRHVVNILKVGIPTAIMQGIMSVMGIFINTILYQFSSTAVAIYGILLRCQNLAQIGVQGMNNGLIPIIAYNYGAKKEKRVHETIRYAFIYAVIIMTVILIAFEFIPDRILMLFDASDQMQKLGIPAVRIMSVSFFVSSIGIIFAAIFQGYGNGNYSMYLVFMRQVILLIPILLIGAFMGNITIIWYGFVIAEALSIPYGIWLYRKIKKSTITPMSAPLAEAL